MDLKRNDNYNTRTMKNLLTHGENKKKHRT